MPGRLALTVALTALACPAYLFAQALPPERDEVAPAHVAYVDGVASLEREGRTDTSPLNMPLLSGDRLRTVDGRVEVQFTDGSTLHLDQRTTLDVQSDDLVRLIDGRLRLNILGPADGGRDAGGLAYRVDSPAGSVRISQPGEYRIALLHPSPEDRAGERGEMQIELAVVRGAAEVFTDQGATPVRAGERAYASAGLAPSYAYAYNSATWDTFDRWSEARRDVRLGVSAEYLPSDMREYAPVLDESGDWRYEQSYGYVWYPRVVADWRPYYHGRWASYPRYGWTWIGADRFAWPTHHFGRWGFSAGAWFWIPGSHWAPAYVSWGYAPGYVSWCPLGFNNRPVIGLNFFSAGPGFYSSSHAWTSMSLSYFGHDNVHYRAVNWDRFDRSRRPVFEERRAAPGFSRDVAVPRNSTPIRWAGSRSIPRDGGSRDNSFGGARGDLRGAQTRDGGSRGVGERAINSAPGGIPPRDNRAVPRNGGAPVRDDSRVFQAGGRTGDTRQAAPRAGAPAPSAVGRPSETPRYVNRGDTIIRSQTERPTPPRQAPVREAAPQTGFPARDGSAMPRRTAPDGPARQIDRRMDPSPDPRVAAPRTSDPRPGMQTAPGRIDMSRRMEARPDSPVYQPRYDARPRGNEPPQRQSAAPAPPPRQAQPPSTPSRAEGRQAPERSAPRETAAPRDSGRSAPAGSIPSRRGGRGGH